MKRKICKTMADFYWRLWTIDAKINVNMRSLSDRCIDIAHYWLMVRGERNMDRYRKYRNIYWAMES